jgi:hypothetical protein
MCRKEGLQGIEDEKALKASCKLFGRECGHARLPAFSGDEGSEPKLLNHH